MTSGAQPERCIYFLFSGDEVVYVGITSDLDTRLKAHRKALKIFNEVRFIRVTGAHVWLLETCLIDILKPVYNVKRTPYVDDNFVFDCGGIQEIRKPSPPKKKKEEAAPKTPEQIADEEYMAYIRLCINGPSLLGWGL